MAQRSGGKRPTMDADTSSLSFTGQTGPFTSERSSEGASLVAELDLAHKTIAKQEEKMLALRKKYAVLKKERDDSMAAVEGLQQQLGPLMQSLDEAETELAELKSKKPATPAAGTITEQACDSRCDALARRHAVEVAALQETLTAERTQNEDLRSRAEIENKRRAALFARVLELEAEVARYQNGDYANQTSAPVPKKLNDSSFVALTATGEHQGRVEDDGEGAWLVNTVAGNIEEGYEDGSNTTARFTTPSDIVMAPDGTTFYIADSGTHHIRRYDGLTGTVTTVAGSQYGFKDGFASTARFTFPVGLGLSPDGLRLYVADSNSHAVRLVELDSLSVTTLIGKLRQPGFVCGTFEETRLCEPTGLAVDKRGLLYVATLSSIVEVDTRAGTTRLIAGSDEGEVGLVDGVGREARFSRPDGLAFRGSKFLIVADSYNHVMRQVDLMTGAVTTVAGTGVLGYRDGSASRAQFKFPQKIAYDPATDAVFVTDLNDAVRVVTLGRGSTVSTVSGTGVPAYWDGLASTASFSFPAGIVWDPTGRALCVCDSDNHCLRRVWWSDSRDDQERTEDELSAWVQTIRSRARCLKCGTEGDITHVMRLLHNYLSMARKSKAVEATLLDLQTKNKSLIGAMERLLEGDVDEPHPGVQQSPSSADGSVVTRSDWVAESQAARRSSRPTSQTLNGNGGLPDSAPEQPIRRVMAGAPVRGPVGVWLDPPGPKERKAGNGEYNNSPVVQSEADFGPVPKVSARRAGAESPTRKGKEPIPVTDVAPEQHYDPPTPTIPRNASPDQRSLVTGDWAEGDRVFVGVEMDRDDAVRLRSPRVASRASSQRTSAAVSRSASRNEGTLEPMRLNITDSPVHDDGGSEPTTPRATATNARPVSPSRSVGPNPLPTAQDASKDSLDTTPPRPTGEPTVPRSASRSPGRTYFPSVADITPENRTRRLASHGIFKAPPTKKRILSP